MTMIQGAGSVISKKKFLVLLSAGLDSTTNLYAANKIGEVALALSFDYGQRAASKEISCAQKICKSLGVPHKVVSLPWFGEFNASSLLRRDQDVPIDSDVSIDDLTTSQKTAKSVWVPNRNGIFLNIAAGFAESLGVDEIIPGFNKEEAMTFPDNSESFMKVLDQSFFYSTSNHVKVHCFTHSLDKTEIVGLAKDLNISFADLWPCYFALEKWCGRCESCQRAKRALMAHQIQCAQWFLK